MNNEEILKKAQLEKCDERETQVKDKSMFWSYVVMGAAVIIFSVIRASQNLAMMDLTATICFSVAANHIYRFVKTKEKSFLFMAIIVLAVAIIATIRFLMGH